MAEPDSVASGVPVWSWRTLLALLAVLVTSTAMRAWVNFSTTYPPAIDAAYYPIQARFLLEHGRLIFPDMPLIFLIDAGLGRIFMAVGRMEISPATLLASRLVDTLLPPLIVIPVFGLSLAWAGPRRASTAALLGAVGASLLAACSFPIVRMTSDFQKNSLGLVWFLGALWACQRGLAHLDRREREGAKAGPLALARQWWPLGLMLLLAATTHVGAFGATCLAIGCAVLAFAFVRTRPSPRVIITVALVGLLVFAGLLGVVYLVAPNKAAAVIKAPIAMFQHGATGPEASRGPEVRSAPGPRMLGSGPGGPGGPGGPNLAWIPVYLLVAFGVWIAWRARPGVSLGDRSFILGAGAAALLLACPLLTGDYAMRLVLMTPAAAACLLAFILAPIPDRPPRRWPAIALSALCLVSVAPALGVMRGPPRGPRDPNGPLQSRGSEGTDESAPPRRRPDGLPGGPPGGMMGGPGVPAGAPEEFAAMLPALGDVSRTLIIARHGTELWAEYFTRASARQVVPENSAGRFDRIFRLVETEGPRGRPEDPAVDDEADLVYRGRIYKLYELKAPARR